MIEAHILVECYAGGRAEEHPRRVTIGNRVYLVSRLLGEYLEVPLNSNQQLRWYKVLTEAGLVLEIVRSTDGAWRLIDIQDSASA
ncbi:MAG TPA: hypothetical protein VKN18_18370 [Blastocatellia bacterium]|nr:hypothetical protein [Blastocatellia bacterium]